MTQIKIQDSVACYHCGDACPPDAVAVGDKAFCCTGCKVVYELLDEHNLCTYYDLEETPGITLKSFFGGDKFAILEDDSVVERLADYRDDHTTRLVLSIPSIHCTSCVWLLENLHQLVDGVLESRVNFLRKELNLSYRHSEVSLRAIADLLARIGYEPYISMEEINGEKSSASPKRRLWLQVGVAGFAFGNIMLFSFPEYLTGLEIDATMKSVFGFLNIALAIPVFAFSSVDYLKSAWSALSNRGINLDVPIALGILVLFGRSLFEIVSGTGAGYFDSFAGFVFLLLIGKLIQQKTYDHLNFDRDYKSYFPISTLRETADGAEQPVAVDQIAPGDIIRIRHQELIPADGFLLGDRANIDYSFVTGESEPVSVEKNAHVYAGGRIVGESARFKVEKEVNNSRLTDLWNKNSLTHSEAEGFVSTLADLISPYFTVTVIAIAFLAAGYWAFTSGGSMAINVLTAVLIVACPCALALSTPFTFGSALNVLSNNGVFVKNTNALERLAEINSVVFDKTGTLTRQGEVAVSFEGDPLDGEEIIMLQQLFRQSAHPLSRSLAAHLATAGQSTVFSNVGDEVSQSEETMAQLTEFEEREGAGLMGSGPKGTIMAGSAQLLRGQGITLPDSQPETGSVVHLALNGSYRGRFTLHQHYREGLDGLIANLKQRFSLHLLTGDNDRERPFLRTLFGSENDMRFSQTPQDKLDAITELRNQGRHVLMIGDGLNDAGAIRKSDFGVALTERVSSFSPACDAIMDAGMFGRLDEVIDFSRNCISVIWVSFVISLLYNTAGLGFAITGNLTPLVAAILMPLSSVTIMIFTTLATRFTAKQMGLQVWR